MSKKTAKSQNKKVSCKENEIKIDLCLEEDEIPERILIKGKVADENLKPIKGAIIKVTDENFNPLNHTKTNCHGEFSLYISEEKIIINAEHKGFYIFTSRVYLKDEKELQNILIKLSKIKQVQNILKGKYIYNFKPIKQIEVELENTKDKNIKYTATTNDKGVFLFSNIPIGKYILSLFSNEYCTKKIRICINNCTKFYNIGIICAKRKMKFGTVNGVITDNSGNPIDNALVVLFDAKKNVPLYATYTNEKGVYLIGGLLPGKYYIIAQK
ncbi:Carboxypeptidase regulatory-like domain-containing protein [Caloramator quimbayensis]|uniref:Carboxypeptidase regulatory-like domain-containing protein n=1 Tax=Caloramator quimbayensis TaxID=1147123 RepID=A0A1T4Y5V2_9CLOT|nr:carboxypeptidase regulatory-like domain-containing protein [Caloramator quimbayensis]SKA97214.1 Carboxypeptidase regulatory-like domain-containing protein [Caloramator quimbayensis]